jgi:hypothetical protein
MPDTINIRADSLRGTHRDERGIANHAKLKLMEAEGLSKSNMAKQNMVY